MAFAGGTAVGVHRSQKGAFDDFDALEDRALLAAKFANSKKGSLEKISPSYHASGGSKSSSSGNGESQPNMQNRDSKMESEKTQSLVSGLIQEKHQIVQKENEKIASQKEQSFLARFVDSNWFQLFSATLIFMNGAIIGVEADVDFTDTWFYAAQEYFFLVAFSCELGLKMYVYKVKFWCGPDAAWNAFDAFLVGVTIFDTFAVQGDSSMNLSVYRMFRLFRLARLVRLFAIFKQLWLFVVGIANAMSIIGWGMMLTVLVTYMGAVFITRQLDDLCEDDQEVHVYFGTMLRSMFTLFQVSTGDSWGFIPRPVIEQKPEMALFFLLFLCVTQMAFLNVIVAVIVESVLKQALKSDNDLLKEAEEKLKQVLHSIYDVFVSMDNDGNGRLTKEEFVKGLNNQDVKIQLQRADVSLQDAEDMFDILDYDGSGTLSLEEFVEGCLKGRGPAKAKDLLAVSCDVHRCQERLSKIEAVLSKLVTNQAALVDQIGTQQADKTKSQSAKSEESASETATAAATAKTVAKTQVGAEVAGSATPQGEVAKKESSSPKSIEHRGEVAEEEPQSPKSIEHVPEQADGDVSQMVDSFNRLLGDDGMLWKRLDKIELMLRQKAFETPKGIFDVGEQLC